MNEKLIARSKRGRFNTTLYIFAIFMLIFLLHLLIEFKPENVYDERKKITGFIFISFFLIYTIQHLLNQKRIFVYEKYFEVKRLFSEKRIYYTEIITYYSENKKSKYNSWNEYYLFLNNQKKITIIDNEYSNFFDFFYNIKLNIKEDKNLNYKLSKSNDLLYVVICGLVGILFLYFSSFFYDTEQNNNNNIVYVKDILLNNVELRKESKGKKSYNFELENYQDLKFKISGDDYYAIKVNDDSFLSMFKKGTIVKVGIEKEDYDKYILKTKELSFSNKYLRYGKIFVKQIQNNKNENIIDIKSSEKDDKTNNYFGIGIFSFLGIFFLGLSIYILKSYLNPNNQEQFNKSNKLHLNKIVLKFSF